MPSLAAADRTETLQAQSAPVSNVIARTRLGFGITVAILGLLQFLATRNEVNVDGISYIDMSDTYLHLGWKGLINGQWSPMYPWLIHVAKSIVGPKAYWEFAALHAVNFIAFLCAAVAFDCLLREIIQRHESAADSVPLPSLPMMVIGYTLFLWYSLKLISIRESSPDMLMSVFVLLAAALIVRIGRTSGTWLEMCGLGVALGLGYYAKAPMLPLSFVFLGVTFWLIHTQKQALLKTLTAFALFVLVCAPLVVGLSRQEHRFTFGDSARLNVLWNIDRAGPLWYWQNLGAAGGKFEHPPQKIFKSPALYEFEAPVPGTQPAWYDPSYWDQGAIPRFLPRREVSLFTDNLGMYVDMLFSEQSAFLVAVAVLILLSGGPRSIGGIARQYPILLPTLAALTMYAVILIEMRYIAVFLALLWVGLFAGVRLPSRGEAQRVGTAVAIGIVLAVGIPIVLTVYNDVRPGLRHPAFPEWQVAQELHTSGIHSGDKVARIGGTYAADWARLLRARVVAEIPRYQATYFWSAAPVIQAQVMEAIHSTGAKAVVAKQIPPTEVFTPFTGWKKVGDTGYFVFVFPESGTK